MNTMERTVAAVRTAAHPVYSDRDYDPLLQMATNAQFVLIGEASHGTEEFYQVRAALTRRLIEEHGFRAVICEADWPDSHRVHRYVTGRSSDSNSDEALGDFRRFPSWMWRNHVMLEFVEWLREWNRAQPTDRQTGFHGMDLYSLHASIEEVLRYLDRKDPAAARAARERYACFEHFSKNPQHYGAMASRSGGKSCEEAVVQQLVELRAHAERLQRTNARGAQEEFFSAEQNARLVVNAERYYRAMFHGRDESWNLRDGHMFETLMEVVAHLDGGSAKVVVWAHNSHLGDARATEMAERGELNVGQLVRERFGTKALLIGFSTYTGSVTAAHDWDEPPQRKWVRPALRGSYEAVFHASGLPAFWLDLRAQNEATELLQEERLQRAIGVAYRPDTERWSHYFHARLPSQFDAIIHLDETHALGPLEPDEVWDDGELAETFPTGV